jgi:AhpC/TSA family
MHRIAAATITLLTFMPALWAQDQPQDKAKDEKPKTPEEQLAAILGELQKGPPEVIKQLKEAKTDEEKDRIRKEFIKREYSNYAARLLQLAEKNEQNDTGLKAAMVLGQLSQAAVRQGSPDADKFLKQAAEKSSSRKVQAASYFALGSIIWNQAQSLLEDKPLETADIEQLDRQAEPLFARIVDKYADIKPIARPAEDRLYVLQHLSIGKEAPIISGKDADGKEFKLSDYRGKVVVIDFWATW